MDSQQKPKYGCNSETKKPSIILVHEPDLETLLAVKNPCDWGFDPSLEKDSRSFDEWLRDAQQEHQEMVSILRSEGIEVLYVKDMLEKRQEELIKYLNNEFRRIEPKIKNFDNKVQDAIQEAYGEILESPVSGLLFGLEFGKSFRNLPYDIKLEVYKILKMFMPQTSLYYTQDPVISSPAGLIKSRMSMWIRRQEPDILELALGKENYIHRLRNVTEGGDVTMCSYAHGGDIFYIDGRMLLGISMLSGKGIEKESELLSKKSKIDNLIRLYTLDFFDPSRRYATENVMHLDTIVMPVDDGELLGNIKILEQSAVGEGKKPIVNAYEWSERNFERIIEVPDNEQQGAYGWGSNVLPLGNRKILSSTHLKQTNKNLREAGFEVIEIDSTTLTSGFGSHHCMTAYLRGPE